jgi:hypothetical protein
MAHAAASHVKPVGTEAQEEKEPCSAHEWHLESPSHHVRSHSLQVRFTLGLRSTLYLYVFPSWFQGDVNQEHVSVYAGWIRDTSL